MFGEVEMMMFIVLLNTEDDMGL